MPELPLFPPQASTIAGRVDALFWFMFAVSGLICFLVFGAMLIFVVKYRRRPGNEVAQRVTGTTPIELTWTIIPLGLAILPFAWGATIYLDMTRPPDNALEVYVVARQWMWKAQHPDGQAEIDELHVPVGRPVKLVMTSQDVIHSFYVPEFRIKQDVLPDRYTTTWFEATRAGEFHLFCAEYCGTEHSRMTGRVIAMQPAAYAAWLQTGATASAVPQLASPAQPTAAAAPASDALVQQGRQIFQQLGCVSCHETGIGPNLQAVFGQPVQLSNGQTVIADENYVRESILNPSAQIVAGFQPIMPSYAGRVSDEQIMALIAYLRSLAPESSGQGPAGAQPSPRPSPAGGPSPSPSPSPSPANSGGRAP